MNFIIFQPDELRAESIGCYGHPLAPTPNIDALAAMRTMTHRLVYRPTGQCELYDLASDPQELYNQYGNAAYGAIQRELEAQLLAWLVQRSDVTPFDTDPRGYS
jgi:arylsulfatase A-like enzyme